MLRSKGLLRIKPAIVSAVILAERISHASIPKWLVLVHSERIVIVLVIGLLETAHGLIEGGRSVLLSKLRALSLAKRVDIALLERIGLRLAVGKFGEWVFIEFGQVTLWLIEVKVGNGISLRWSLLLSTKRCPVISGRG